MMRKQDDILDKERKKGWISLDLQFLERTTAILLFNYLGGEILKRTQQGL